MSERAEILGVGFDSLSREELTEKLNKMLDRDSGGYLVTPNPEILMCADEDAEYREILNDAELCIADGVGVVCLYMLLYLRKRSVGICRRVLYFQRGLLCLLIKIHQDLL